MRRFSRWMPGRPEDSTLSVPIARLIGGGLLVALLIGMILSPGFRYGLLALSAVVAVGAWVEHRRLSRLAAARPGEGLCTFARALDRHEMDPWIVRATYEELTVHSGREALPLRPSDRLEADLGMDWEDVDDALQHIASRVGRSLDDTPRNPLYGKVTTIGDIMRFIMLQPPRAAV